MRKYVTQMGWAAFRQNEIQIETEKDRQRLLEYLSAKKWSNPKLFLKYVQTAKNEADVDKSVI